MPGWKAERLRSGDTAEQTGAAALCKVGAFLMMNVEAYITTKIMLRYLPGKSYFACKRNASLWDHDICSDSGLSATLSFGIGGRCYVHFGV